MNAAHIGCALANIPTASSTPLRYASSGVIPDTLKAGFT